jgi:hypothetical protein
LKVVAPVVACGKGRLSFLQFVLSSLYDGRLRYDLLCFSGALSMDMELVGFSWYFDPSQDLQIAYPHTTSVELRRRIVMTPRTAVTVEALAGIL